MIFMFITGIVLALLLGLAGGILFAKHERSVFTKKFKAELDSVAREYEKQLLDLQKKDAEAVKRVQEALKTSMSEALLSGADIPPPEKFN